MTLDFTSNTVWKTLFPDFTKEEMTCKCGCGLMNMTYMEMEVLQDLRRYVQKGVVVTSGSRCEKHNKASGGGKNSRHLTGLAVDVRVGSSYERARILEFLFVQKVVKGVGIANGFVHFDVDQSREVRVCWLY